MPNELPTFRESSDAFRDAIRDERLTTDSRSPLYAGNFMYMGTWNGQDTFKNRNTRRYLAANEKAPTVVVQGIRVSLGDGTEL